MEEEKRFDIGDRVSLLEGALDLGYIHAKKDYTNMRAGLKGTIVRYTNDGSKAGVQFDEQVFKTPGRSSHDNGCHGHGHVGYCWYIPEEYLNYVSPSSEVMSSGEDSDCIKGQDMAEELQRMKDIISIIERNPKAWRDRNVYGDMKAFNNHYFGNDNYALSIAPGSLFEKKKIKESNAEEKGIMERLRELMIKPDIILANLEGIEIPTDIDNRNNLLLLL